MGRNGFGVSFSPADESRPADFYADRFDQLGAMVDEVIEAEHRVAVETARRTEAIERARQFSEAIANDPPSGNATPRSVEIARRAFVCEVAAALRMPDRTAERLIHTGQTLVHDLPATLLALGEGRLSFRHAQILVDHSYGLEAGLVRELETRMIPVAASNTPARFERSVRRARERLAPESMGARHERAVIDRSTEVVPEQDGMVFIGAHVSAVVGIAIDNRVTALAKSLQVDGEERTLTQLKADVFGDLLLGGHGTAAPGTAAASTGRFRDVRATVLVTIPAMTLLGHSTRPAELEGYGPIDHATARQIASQSKTLRRMLTDPVSGIVLNYDRRQYRVPKDLRTWLRVRDGTCRFPGCNRSAEPCELDHTDDWALGGGTNHTNLAHLCKKHHTLKGASRWRVQQVGDATLRWISPAKIPYETSPESGATA